MHERFPGQEPKMNTEAYPLEGITPDRSINAEQGGVTPAPQSPKDERLADALSDVHSLYPATEEGNQSNPETLKVQNIHNAIDSLNEIVETLSGDGNGEKIDMPTRKLVGELVMSAYAEVQAALDAGDPQEELIGVHRRLAQLSHEVTSNQLVEYHNRKYDLMFSAMDEAYDLEQLINLPASTEWRAASSAPQETVQPKKPLKKSLWQKFFKKS